MSHWKSRLRTALRVSALALTILALNSETASAQWRGRGGFVGRGGYGYGRGFSRSYWPGGFYGRPGGYGYGYRGYGAGGFGVGLGLGYGLGSLANGYRYSSGYAGYSPPVYNYSTTVVTAPYATGQTYSPGDGYTYPLYYDPAMGRYIYYPR